MSANLTFATPSGPLSATINRVVAAGYTGRTRHLVEAHVAEFKELGIPAPPHVPMLFPIIPGLLSQSSATTVLGEETSPEVEYVIFRVDGLDYVTVGSDQTDSVMEAQNAPIAKNMCLKSIAKDAWLIDEVVDHWDELELSLTCNGKLMQKGKVDQMMTPSDLRDFVAEHDGPVHEGRLIFSGTLEMHDRCPKTKTEMVIRLNDPVLGRSIEHRYTVEPVFPYF